MTILVKVQLHKKGHGKHTSWSIDESIMPSNEEHKADPHLFEMNLSIQTFFIT